VSAQEHTNIYTRSYTHMAKTSILDINIDMIQI